MSGEAARAIRRMGRTVSLTLRGETKEWKAVIEPLRYKNKMYLSSSYLPPGLVDGSHFLYLGPPDHPLRALPFDACLRAGGEGFLVKSTDAVYLGEEPLYIWAVLQRQAEEKAEEGWGE